MGIQSFFVLHCHCSRVFRKDEKAKAAMVKEPLLTRSPRLHFLRKQIRLLKEKNRHESSGHANEL